MGVYIKDMKVLGTGNYLVTVDNNTPEKTIITFRLACDTRKIIGSYELTAIHDHGRLVDADAAERHLVKMQQAQKDIVARGVRKSRAVLRDIPTIIPADKE